MNLNDLTAQELFGLYAQLMNELKSRGLSRSMNNPIADYAELLVGQALNAEIQQQSNASFDLLDQNGIRYQVKARRPTLSNPSRQLSFLRDMQEKKFDYLVGVLFNENFTIQRAAIIPWEVVSAYSRYRQREHVWIFHLEDKIWDTPGVKELKLSEIETFENETLRQYPNTEKPDMLASTPFCLCGCGKNTVRQQANFISGHDAKLKSKISKKDPTLIPEGMAYARQNWPQLFSDMKSVEVFDSVLKAQLVTYLEEHPELFETKPQLNYIPVIGQNIHCWKSTRLKLLRNGIEPMTELNDILVIKIRE